MTHHPHHHLLLHLHLLFLSLVSEWSHKLVSSVLQREREIGIPRRRSKYIPFAFLQFDLGYLNCQKIEPK